MEKSKLIQLLKHLSPREHTRFRKYVQSPFFNKHKDVLILYDYIIAFAPTFEHPRLKKEIIVQELSSLNDSKHFYNVTSYLLELLCDFIAYLEQEKNKLQHKLYTIKGLNRRGISKQLPASIRQYKLLSKQYPYQDNQHYQEQYNFFDELDSLFLEQGSAVQDENLQLKSNYLDLFYLSTKLQIACDMVSRNNVIKANYNCHLIEELLAYLEQNLDDYWSSSSIKVYYQILKMLIEKDEVHYFNLKTCLKNDLADISTKEAKLMYDYAENYCIRKINSGYSNYYQEFLDLYKAQLEMGTLMKDGYLNERDYKNIITAGIRTKDYIWTETFIHNNKKLLKKEVRQNAFVYNLGAFYYATQQYSEALSALNTVEFTDATYHLGAKDIQLKIYYDLNESEAFFSLIKAFRIYVKRNKQLSEYRKEVYLNYLKIAKKMASLKEKSPYVSKERFKQEFENLTHEIKNTKAIANSDWIQMVLQQLKDE